MKTIFYPIRVKSKCLFLSSIGVILFWGKQTKIHSWKNEGKLIYPPFPLYKDLHQENKCRDCKSWTVLALATADTAFLLLLAKKDKVDTSFALKSIYV